MPTHSRCCCAYLSGLPTSASFLTGGFARFELSERAVLSGAPATSLRLNAGMAPSPPGFGWFVVPWLLLCPLLLLLSRLFARPYGGAPAGGIRVHHFRGNFASWWASAHRTPFIKSVNILLPHICACILARQLPSSSLRHAPDATCDQGAHTLITKEPHFVLLLLLCWTL